MNRPLARLRWQLTLSHLIAIAFTLLSMTAAIALIVASRFAAERDPSAEAAQHARTVAAAVAAPLGRGASPLELSAVLRVLVDGGLDVASVPPWVPAEAAVRFERSGPWHVGLAYAALVGPDGRVLASSAPDGGAFAPPERGEWSAVVGPALAGQRDPRRLVVLPAGAGPAALAAHPVVDERGRTVAAVVVAESALPPPPGPGGSLRALVFFGAASVAVLAGAFVFALVSAGLVGYLLSRRLVGRLERLGRAVEALAAGELTRRVEEGAPDEVGQLARRFNHMADRLAATVGELEAAQRRTEAALQAKRELVANVSHELRTPLASIRGHTESLLMQAAPPAGYPAPGTEGDGGADVRREYLGVIHRESEQLSRLIDDLFTLSTAEAGALPLALEPVRLAEVVEEVAASVRPAAHRERRVTVVTAVAPDLPPALADRRRVVQVLANLVRNALRHTPEGGLVALRAERRDDRAWVAVEDTGVGIPPERLPHVFERFYRGDDARDRASGGAGLGLAIVRELVEAMGGDVAAESTVGQGSRFSFRLPLATT
ncbi:MAG TPA: ATP-binding protein [Chloroflexota bacterium]|nr:ATP-binding protein [Chloroflexota bacterium]